MRSHPTTGRNGRSVWTRVDLLADSTPPGRMASTSFPCAKRLLVRRCLKILVGDMQIAVAQVVADHELVFAHLRQHGSHRVPKCVPAHTRDSDPPERRLDLLLQHRSQVERFAALAVFPKGRRNRPAGCRDFVISIPARPASDSDASATALQTLPFLCSSGVRPDASSTNVGH